MVANLLVLPANIRILAVQYLHFIGSMKQLKKFYKVCRSYLQTLA